MTYTVSCCSDFDITDPINGCQQLAGLLNYREAKIAYVQQLSCLTRLTRLSWTAKSERSPLEDLEQLSLLQTLELSRLSSFPWNIQNLKFVQSLRLCGIDEEVCNIESHTQLTHLLISISYKDRVKEILLPCGNGVKLRRLDIWGPCHGHIFHLRNLTFATRLEKMSLSSAFPQNIEQVSSSALSFLTCLQCVSPDRALLQTITLCSSLQILHVFCYQQTTLPSTFSLLTQLKGLILSGCCFAQFPICLLHMSQLESLRVSCNQPAFHLCGSILGLAKWPNLKSLDIGDCWQSQFPVESQLLLGQLQKQLRGCNSSCKLNFGRR